MTRRARIRAKHLPPEELRFLDLCSLDREGVYRAWRYGRLYGRSEALKAICALPSAFDDEEKERSEPR
jgi:hypothetical protein